MRIAFRGSSSNSKVIISMLVSCNSAHVLSHNPGVMALGQTAAFMLKRDGYVTIALLSIRWVS